VSRTEKFISEGEIMFARSNAIVAMEAVRSSWREMSDEWKAYTGGWCLAYSMKLDKTLAVFGVKLEDDPELERHLSKMYEQA